MLQKERCISARCSARCLLVPEEIALELVDKEQGWWKYAGEGEEYRLGKERREILEVLANADEPLKPREIAEALDKPAPNVSKLLQKMREDGDVDNEGYGRYVPRAGVSTLTTAQPVQVVQPVQVEPPVEPGSVGPLGPPKRCPFAGTWITWIGWTGV